jgi:triosephosphate isomerase
MQKFLTAIIISVLTDEKVQAVIKNLLGQLITERILPLVPVAVGAAVKASMDQLIAKVPGIEGVVDVVHATDAARENLNTLLPDIDFGIPALDNLLDFWRPKA